MREDVRGTSAAKPALVFIKCIVEPEGFEPPTYAHGGQGHANAHLGDTQ